MVLKYVLLLMLREAFLFTDHQALALKFPSELSRQYVAFVARPCVFIPFVNG